MQYAHYNKVIILDWARLVVVDVAALVPLRTEECYDITMYNAI